MVTIKQKRLISYMLGLVYFFPKLIIVFNNCIYYKITINKRYFKSKVTE